MQTESNGDTATYGLRAWLASLEPADGASCDRCGWSEGPFVKVKARDGSYCHLCAANDRGFEEGEAHGLRESIVALLRPMLTHLAAHEIPEETIRHELKRLDVDNILGSSLFEDRVAYALGWQTPD